MSLSGWLAFVSNRWHVSDSPAVTNIVRALFAVGAVGVSFLDDADYGRKPIYSFLTAELVYAWLTLLGRALGTPEAVSPLRLAILLQPAASALGFATPSSLGGLLLRAL